jgi:hypothetical protein
MGALAAVSNGIHAAFLLARGRADGLLRVEDDMAGAARSFWALLLCVPADLCLLLISWAVPGEGGTVQVLASPARAIVLDLLVFVVGWLAFAVVSHRIAGALGRAELWPRYIAAWNWCNFAQQLLLLASGLIALAGAPPWASQTADLVALGWALWLEWFATRLALRLPGLPAAGLVAIDTLIGTLLLALASGG